MRKWRLLAALWIAALASVLLFDWGVQQVSLVSFDESAPPSAEAVE